MLLICRFHKLDKLHVWKRGAPTLFSVVNLCFCALFSVIECVANCIFTDMARRVILWGGGSYLSKQRSHTSACLISHQRHQHCHCPSCHPSTFPIFLFFVNHNVLASAIKFCTGHACVQKHCYQERTLERRRCG